MEKDKVEYFYPNRGHNRPEKVGKRFIRSGQEIKRRRVKFPHDALLAISVKSREKNRSLLKISEDSRKNLLVEVKFVALSDQLMSGYALLQPQINAPILMWTRALQQIKKQQYIVRRVQENCINKTTGLRLQWRGDRHDLALRNN